MGCEGWELGLGVVGSSRQVAVLEVKNAKLAEVAPALVESYYHVLCPCHVLVCLLCWSSGLAWMIDLAWMNSSYPNASFCVPQ